MKLRVLAAAAAVLLLAGCGSVHPGAAAVVDDTVISMGDADDTAMVYCRLTLLQGVQGAPPASSDLRREAVRDLVIGDVARTMAKQRDISVSPSAYEVTPAQRRQLEKAFDADQMDMVVRVIERTQETYAIAQELGMTAGNVPATDDTQAIQAAGLQVLQKAMARHDVSYDPRFGMKADGEEKSTPNTLSVAKVALDDRSPKGLPATQRCG